MSDVKIVTEKELNYIETLYLSCNLEDFLVEKRKSVPSVLDHGLHVSSDDLSDNLTAHEAYKYMMSYYYDTLFTLPPCISLGVAEGRTWYKMPNYRIGIMDYNTAKKANQFNCVIQYEQHYMFTLDQDLNNIDYPFGGSPKNYNIKRIDVTKIIKCNTDYTKGYGFISPFRGIANYYGTIYLGHRKNGNVVRIYDKTKELLDTDNGKKIELLSSYFGDIENLYTFELELRRSHLKENLGIQTMADIPKIFEVYKNTLGKIRIYEDTDHNKKLIAQGNRSRINAEILTDFEEFSRIKKKKYVPSVDYAIDKAVRILDRYLSSMDLDRTNENYLPLINKIISKRIDNSFMDTTLVLTPNDFSDSIRKMKFKHIAMRDNQSNDLERDSFRIYGRCPLSMSPNFVYKSDIVLKNDDIILPDTLF